MALFSATVAAKLAGREVGLVPLGFFDFFDLPMRLWPGFGPLDAGGYEWSGTGDLGSIEGLTAAAGDAAQSVTFRLSGITPEIQALARDAEARVKGRAVVVYVQAFDVVDDPVAGRSYGQRLDAPVALWAGRMDVMTFSASGPTERSVTLTAESFNADRRRPSFGLMTDADQRARWPGDGSLRFRPYMRAKSLRIPW